MKSIVHIFFTTFTLFVLISCNEEKKKEEPTPEVVKTEVKQPLPNIMYVIAPSGLLVRKKDNLDSEQIAKMPYGTRVEVLSRPDNQHIKVANINGHMIQIRYNDITGFAYNGYLTRFKVPQAKEKPEDYAQRIKEEFPQVTSSSESVEKNNMPTTTAQLSIPAGSWSEAFLIAKQLFDIPAEYVFPGLNGPNESSVKSHQKHIFTSTLETARSENELNSITYTESAEGFSRMVTITKNEDLYVLTQHMTAD